MSSQQQQRILILLQAAEAVYGDLLRGEVLAEDRARLAPPIARLAKAIIPNIHQKVDEIVFASENGLRVNPQQHGPDMFDDAGNPIELKVSVVTQSNKNTAHFNWPVPGKGKSDAVRRKLLLESIDTKTKGGYAILIIRNGRGEELERFRLPHAFLRGYFERIVIRGSDKHLISSAQCRKCKKFHRMEKYRSAATAETIDWDDVMAQTKSQCR